MLYTNKSTVVITTTTTTTQQQKTGKICKMQTKTTTNKIQETNVGCDRLRFLLLSVGC